MFIDLDGTLTEPLRNSFSLPAQTKAVIAAYQPSLMVPSHCYATRNLGTDLWNDTVYCDSTVTMRGILFTNGIPKIDFATININVRLLSDPMENISAAHIS